MDCIVVGYHEPELDSAQLTSVLAALDDLPASLHNLSRSNLMVDGQARSYLDTLSYLRREPGAASGSHYSVAEMPNLASVYLTNYLRRQGRSACFINSFTHEQARLADLLADDVIAVAITTTFYMVPGSTWCRRR